MTTADLKRICEERMNKSKDGLDGALDRLLAQQMWLSIDEAEKRKRKELNIPDSVPLEVKK